MKEIKKSSIILIFGFLLIFVIGTIAAGPGRRSSRKGYLGVSIERLTRDEREDLGVTHGVVVTRVTEKSPAAKSGIVEDDVILYFNGKKIRRPDHLVEAVREVKPKSTVMVTLMREKKRMDLDVVVGRYRSSAVYSWGGDGEHFSVLAGGGAYLGVELHSLNQNLAGYFGVDEDDGALILDVEEESPAAEAGMRAGDVIVSVDGDDVMDPYDVRDILYDFEEGDQIEIEVMRQKHQQTFTVELEEHANHSSIHILRGLRDEDRDHRRRMRMVVPHHFDIDVPEIDFDLDHDFDIEDEYEFDDHTQININGRRRGEIRKKLDVIEEKIREKAKNLEEKLHQMKEIYTI
jgi:predicted metalloprotease with PDZ domain